jgi:hypothetical protein
MSSVLKIFFMITPIMIFSGCNEKYIQKEVPKKNTSIQKEVQTKSTRIEKDQYEYCQKHIQIMDYASKYVLKEFDEGYFVSKDIVGAKAQLFLIENKSPTLFSKNINTALRSYSFHYNLAKKNRCDIKCFQSSLLTKIKSKIKELENEKAVVAK